MKRLLLGLGIVGLLAPIAASAQENAISEGMNEVVVTAQRREANDYSSETPAVGLLRKADFAVLQVAVSGDSRDKAVRESEIFEMIKAAITAAPRNGVQLAYGARTLQPLTLANYRELSLNNDRRPDSQRVSFLAKVPLGDNADAKLAQERITAFVKSVKPVGRALLEETGDLQLSIVAPDQYRGAVVDAIAADAKAMAAKLGDGYGVQIDGLSRPVEWVRAGLSDVMIFVPYRLVILPKP